MLVESYLLWYAAAIVLLFGCVCFGLFLLADADILLLVLERFGKPVCSLRGKVAWVTGAASGIGRQLAHLLAKNGVKLVLSDLDLDKLNTVRDECFESSSLHSEDILVLPFNLTHKSDHQECLDKVVAHFGQVDIVFHNAGCSQRADYSEISDEVDRDLFDINCFGHVSLSRLILKQFLRQGGGQFVVTSSAFGKFAFPRAATYVASKHALMGYFNTLRLEYATKGISVTVVCPGPVFSGLYDKSFTETSGKYYSGGMQATDRRMAASRCAYLMLVATANQVDEAWPCLQPGLIWLYMNQFLPTLATRIFVKIVNSGVADVVRDGRKQIF